MQAFSIRDLREHSGELSQEAKAGHISLITERGQPLFVAEHVVNENSAKRIFA